MGRIGMVAMSALIGGMTHRSSWAVPPSGEEMWADLLGQILYYEFVCDEENLLSAASARARRKHPVLVCAFTAVTVAHLMDWLPEKFDPYVVVGFRMIQIMKGSTR